MLYKYKQSNIRKVFMYLTTAMVEELNLLAAAYSGIAVG